MPNNPDTTEPAWEMYVLVAYESIARRFYNYKVGVTVLHLGLPLSQFFRMTPKAGDVEFFNLYVKVFHAEPPPGINGKSTLFQLVIAMALSSRERDRAAHPVPKFH